MSDRKTGSESDIMTLREVAAYLNCHYSTIYRLLGNGARFLPSGLVALGGFAAPISRPGLKASRWSPRTRRRAKNPGPRKRAQAPAKRPLKPRPKRVRRA